MSIPSVSCSLSIRYCGGRNRTETSRASTGTLRKRSGTASSGTSRIALQVNFLSENIDFLVQESCESHSRPRWSIPRLVLLAERVWFDIRSGALSLHLSSDLASTVLLTLRILLQVIFFALTPIAVTLPSFSELESVPLEGRARPSLTYQDIDTSLQQSNS